MRITKILLSLALLAGCADEGTKTDCVGLDCISGFQWPDGGELRIQYVLFPDGVELTRISAIFKEHQDPEINPPMPLGRCRNLNPDVELQGVDREYIDVGDSVTFNLGDMEVVVPKVQNADGTQVTDPGGRKHDFYYFTEITTERPEGFFNTTHTAHIEDTSHVDFSDAVDASRIYIPPKQAVDIGGTPIMQLPVGGEFTVSWERPDPFAREIAHVGTLFYNTPGEFPTFCMTPDLGSYTMSAEDIDELPGDSGLVLVGSATNEAVLTDNGRMLNVWGIYCHLIPWMKVY